VVDPVGVLCIGCAMHISPGRTKYWLPICEEVSKPFVNQTVRGLASWTLVLSSMPSIVVSLGLMFVVARIQRIGRGRS